MSLATIRFAFAVVSGFSLVAFYLTPATQTQQPQAPPPLPKVLADQIGTWDAEVDLGGTKSKGVEIVTAIGQNWIMTDFRGEVMGMPYHGHGVTGFDTQQKKLVSIWADSMDPSLARMEGVIEGSAIIMHSVGVDETGKPVKTRHTTRVTGAKSRDYLIENIGDDGKAKPSLSIKYTKRLAPI